MIGLIVEFSDLQRLSGFDRRADVERWANSIGLHVKACRAGVWTTVPALNEVLGVTERDDEQYPPGVV
jgi:hypothetical protein